MLRWVGQCLAEAGDGHGRVVHVSGRLRPFGDERLPQEQPAPSGLEARPVEIGLVSWPALPQLRQDPARLAEPGGGAPVPAPADLFARVLKPAARRAGVPWAGFHTLRHTCATMLFRRGLNAKQVQVWLGHHSPAFTLAVYVHLLSDDLPDPTFWDDPPEVETPEVALPEERAL